MSYFEQNLQTIAAYPVVDGTSWYHFCDFVAAVGSGEVVNSPNTPTLSAIQQDPQRLIFALTKLRNSGFELLSRVPVQNLTAPPNHFSSMISTLKIYGAPRTAEAVKRAAYMFWQNIESKVGVYVSEEVRQAAASAAPAPEKQASAPIDPVSHEFTRAQRQLTEDLSLSAELVAQEKARRSTAVKVGLSAAALLGAIWYLKK